MKPLFFFVMGSDVVGRGSNLGRENSHFTAIVWFNRNAAHKPFSISATESRQQKTSFQAKDNSNRQSQAFSLCVSQTLLAKNEMKWKDCCNATRKNCPPDTYTRLAKDFISHTCIFSRTRNPTAKEYQPKKKQDKTAMCS